MARKKTMKIPKRVSVKCPNCSGKKRVEVSAEKGMNYFDCEGCGQNVKTPITKCCIICAFSDKKCPSSLVMEAKIKKLELR
jgi:Zn ribbon nucleic-acid-binding protein